MLKSKTQEAPFKVIQKILRNMITPNTVFPFKCQLPGQNAPLPIGKIRFKVIPLNLKIS